MKVLTVDIDQFWRVKMITSRQFKIDSINRISSYVYLNKEIFNMTHLKYLGLSNMSFNIVEKLEMIPSSIRRNLRNLDIDDMKDCNCWYTDFFIN